MPGTTSNGVLIVAAAGNDGDATLYYPAAYAEVVSVAATDSNDGRATFSNANADVEIAAPGVNVLSTVRGGGYATLSGTSMATPHVSAVAGVLVAGVPGGQRGGDPQPPGCRGQRPRPRRELRLRSREPL